MNRTLKFHSFHPKVGIPSRVSYTVDGVPGNVVIFLSLFADGVPPQEIVVDVDLAEPKPDASSAKAAAALVKAQEKADKAIARAKAQEDKAAARAVKAQAALDAAQAALASA